MNIQPKSRTVTDIVIELSEDEAREAIHTPDKLQTAIRKAFAAQRAKKSGGGWTDDAYGHKDKKPPKEKQRRASRPCQYCGKMIKNSIHENKCPDNPANAPDAK